MEEGEEFLDNNITEETIDRLKIILATGSALLRWKKLASASKDRFYRLKELITT